MSRFCLGSGEIIILKSRTKKKSKKNLTFHFFSRKKLQELKKCFPIINKYLLNGNDVKIPSLSYKFLARNLIRSLKTILSIKDLI